MKIEIWSDVVCPWCYVGKRRFEAAMERFGRRRDLDVDRVEIIWRSFELDRDAPRRAEEPVEAMLARKYGVTVEKARAMNARVTEAAAAEGLDFRLDEARHGNTFDAHRLIHLAGAHGRQAEAQERLMRAYFTEGLPVGDPDTLAALGAELGLPAGEVREMLAGDAYADAVRADERRAARFGIRGVPFFAIDETYGVSGAQPAETMLAALEKAWSERPRPLTSLGAEEAADGCDDGSCAA